MSTAQRSAIAYDFLANRHRPPSLEQHAPAIRELRRHGLQVRDIAAALRLNDADVCTVLGEYLNMTCVDIASL